MNDFQLFFEQTSIIALLLQGETIVRLTKAASQTFGDHYLNQPLSDLLPPADASLILEKAADNLNIALYGISIANTVFDLQSSRDDASVWLVFYPRQSSEDLNPPSAGDLSLLNDMSVIGQEMRVPLTPILSALSLLTSHMKSTQNEKSRRYFASLMQNCFRLLRLSNNLIELPQYTTGNMHLHLSERDLSAFAAELFDSFIPFATVRGLRTQFKGSKNPLHLAYDEQRIERLLYNLFSNALKNTPPDGLITLSVWSDTDFAYLRVSDTGRGIPKDKISSLFHTAAAGHPGGGLGLGLSLVRMIAELHGGTVMLESRQDKGTVVTVTLSRKNTSSNILRSHSVADYTGEFSHALVELSDSIPGGHPLYGNFGWNENAESGTNE